MHVLEGKKYFGALWIGRVIIKLAARFENGPSGLHGGDSTEWVEKASEGHWLKGLDRDTKSSTLQRYSVKHFLVAVALETNALIPGYNIQFAEKDRRRLRPE